MLDRVAKPMSNSGPTNAGSLVTVTSDKRVTPSSITRVKEGSYNGSWSAESIKLLRELTLKKETPRRIAVKVNSTPEGVLYMQDKLGLNEPLDLPKKLGPRPKFTAEQDDILRRAWKAGKSIKAIAYMIPGKTFHQIKGRRAQINLPSRSQGREVRFTVMLDKEMSSKVGMRASVEGMSKAQYIRKAVLKELER